MDNILALLRETDGLSSPRSRAALAEIGRGLAVAPGERPSEGKVGPDDAGAREGIGRDGFGTLEAAVSAGTCEQLGLAIDRLVSLGLPAMFVYLFADPWAAGDAIGERVSKALGRRYELVEDVWAWRVAPGIGRGWPPHRGIPTPVLVRDAPELLNVWVALSDVEADRACMHFVPLDADPAYPIALEGVSAPAEAARAAPLAAGDALVFNANILHWGGHCSPDAKGPRRSCSFTFAREDALEKLAVRIAAPADDLGARLDAVARQVVTYGKGQPDVSDAALTWAEGHVTLGAVDAFRTSDKHLATRPGRA
jgi:hypothetical protein